MDIYSPYVIGSEKECFIDSQVFEKENIEIVQDVAGFEDLTYNIKHFSIGASIMAIGDIIINSEHIKSISDKNTFIYSTTGDITINTIDIESNSIIYAPNGTVTLIAENTDIKGKIFANHIVIRGKQINVTNVSLSTDENDVYQDARSVAIGYYYPDSSEHVTKNIILPTVGENGSIITWESGSPDIIDNHGNITRPEEKSVVVKLNASIKKGKAEESKQYEIKVIKKASFSSIKDNTQQDLMALNNGVLPEISFEESMGIVDFIMGKYSDINVESPEKAIHSLNSVKSILQINSPENEFIWEQTNDSFGFKAFRLQQIYKGIEVYGRGIVVGVAEDGEITGLSSSYLPDILTAEVDVNPRIDVDTAIENIQYLYGNNIEVYEQKLIIYSSEVSPRLAWCIMIEGEDKEENYVSENIFVDAVTGNVIHTQNNNRQAFKIESMKLVAGKGTTDKKEDFFEANVIVKSKNPRTIQLYHSGYNIKVYDYAIDKKKIVETQETNFNGEQFGTAVDAYRNLVTVYERYKQLFGREGIDCEGRYGIGVKATVNYRDISNVPLGNAQWRINKKQFVFGEAEKGKRAWSKPLDIVAHEYTHGVIYYKTGEVGIGNAGVAGAIEEAYADVIGNYIEGKGVWYFGEDLYMNDASIAMRALNNPNYIQASSRIGDAYYGDPAENPSGLNDYGHIHNNSTIISHAMYKMSCHIQQADMLRILYKSIDYYKATKITFNKCRNAIKQAAEELCKKKYGDTYKYSKIIDKAFAEAGICRDMVSTDWYYDEMMAAYNKGLISGYEDGTMRPSQLMTVAEFISAVAKAYKAYPERTSDVLGYARNHGWISSDEAVNGCITREKAADILWKAYNTEKSHNTTINLKEYTKNDTGKQDIGWWTSGVYFADQENINKSSYNEAIFQMFANNIYRGQKTGENTIRLEPKERLSRAMACSIIMRTLA